MDRIEIDESDNSDSQCKCQQVLNSIVNKIQIYFNGITFALLKVCTCTFKRIVVYKIEYGDDKWSTLRHRVFYGY